MSNQLYIQEGVVSTTTKKTGLAQLFDMRKWVTDLLINYNIINVDPCCASGTTGISGNISQATYSVFTGIAASGTTAVDATVLDYGVNVIETASSNNIAVKLPQPKTGRSVKVINMTSSPIYLFPSNPGGKINNLPIDTAVVIPPDGVSYEFVCTENPAPGNWNGLSTPSTSSFSYQVSVSHTHGTATYVGIDTSTGTLVSGSTAYISNNGNNTFTLNPSSSVWKTFSTPTTATYLKVYTNILPTDVTGGMGNTINVSREQVFMYDDPILSGSSYATTSYLFPQLPFDSSIPGINGSLSQVTNGPISGLVVNIGDMDTEYCEVQEAALPAFVAGYIPGQLGPIPSAPGMKSNIYFTYKIYIPASAATKTYDFLIVQEYM